ncbi:rhodanese-like domain-containing protein [Streptomyces sp. DW4-2]|uniref:Rhodanese-like domain-containing protein n=2 Tax=Streptomyces spirodelae TaxID=2812904 RepID=A0ABS3WTJ2_9ACTN|nr:rhodanese-like domain-containing protein [Streptomyces spirodelae]
MMEPNQLQQQQDRVQLVDVREPSEWYAGRIPGARWIPMGELSGRLDELERERPVVTVCRSGHRSGQMADYLTERGYRAENLDGGVTAWTEQGLPLRRPHDEKPGEVA